MGQLKRFGIVIRVKPEKFDEYKALHAASQSGIRDLLVKYNIRNFSIFSQTLDDGNDYLFGYYEYMGNNYEADMAKLAAEPRNIEWLKMCDPCQRPLNGKISWATMEEIYHND